MGKQKFNTLPDYNLSRPLAKPKYKVIYHLNNDDIVFNQELPVDTQVYSKGEQAEIMADLNACVSLDGVYGYNFEGWSANEQGPGIWMLGGGLVIQIQNSDVHLYAQWSRYDLLIIDRESQTITGYLPDFSYVPRLVIPEYFEGIRLIEIGHRAFADCPIDEIVIPPSIRVLRGDALSGWDGTKLRFIDAPVSLKYPALTLGDDALGDLNNVSKVILPYRWWYHEGTELLYTGVKNVRFTLCIRNRKSFIQSLNDNREINFGSVQDGNKIDVIWEYNE